MKDYNNPFIRCLPTAGTACYIGVMMPDQHPAPIGMNWGVSTLTTVAWAPSGARAHLCLSVSGANCLDRLRRFRSQLPEPPPSMVVAVPTYFVDADRQAIYEASLTLGLPLLRILNAPTAAALACRPAIPDGRVVLTLDLDGTQVGGALMRLADHPEILATGHARRNETSDTVLPLVSQLTGHLPKPEFLILSGTWNDETTLLDKLIRQTGSVPLVGQDPAFAAACGAALQGYRLSRRAA